MLARAIVAAALLISSPAFAQAPHADWRTIETERFRIHYPAPWEEWARLAAARLETSRGRVEKEVGFTIEETIDVLVMDPVAIANGSAWPILGKPRLVLWTSPPEPESPIGVNRDWIELLAVHETAHLAHLLRPARNPLDRLTAALLPIGPLATAPRWVTEGYATLIEGDLTASGRPYGDFRAAVLRKWAQQGRLPSYAALASDRQSWMGMSMAYLVGSAYLEWLRDREGAESLRNLWRRMSARQQRSFAEAFEGVFGDTPQALYRRFTAEVTAKALEVERIMEPTRREGELWQDLSWTTEEPDVAPGGERIVTVIRKRNQPPRMVILSTGPNSEAEEKDRKRIEKMLKRDPEDVAPVRRKPLPRKPLHEIAGRDGGDFLSPRWSADGTWILFTRFEPDGEGFYHPDLFRWTPGSGAIERLTRLADVRNADPSPDGRSAVAVRNVHGFSELVTVDLSTGAVRSISQPSIESPVASPRWSRDGSLIAYVKQFDRRWRLFVRDVAAGGDREVAIPVDAIVAQPAWGAGDVLFAVVGRLGFFDIHRFDLSEASFEQVTRTMGGALAPAPAADGSALYFLSIDADGLDLRKLDLSTAAAPLPQLALARSLEPVVRRTFEGDAPEEPASPPEVPAWRPYGIGRQEFSLHNSISWLPSNQATEIGARFGDVVGRLDTLAIASIPIGEGESGGSVATVWRGWPVHLRAHLFTSTQDASEQPKCETSLPGCSPGLFDLERRGAELAASWSARSRIARLGIEGGVLFEEIDHLSDSYDHRILFAEVEPRIRRSFGRFRAGAQMRGRYDNGRTDGPARLGPEIRNWDRTRVSVSGEIGWARAGAGLEWERGSRESAKGVALAPGSTLLPFDLFELGGTVSSIHPRSALANRIEVPALPIGTSYGTDHEAQKVTASIGLPFRAFYERHRLWFAVKPDEWIELAGAEATATIAPQPLLRLPALELRLGVARILTEPLHGDVTWWVSTVWRP